MRLSLASLSPSFSSAAERRNYWLGVSNGILSVPAEAFIQPHIVMTLFVSLLTSSNLLIGLVAPLRVAGWYLPQLLIAGRLQQRERFVPLYRRVGVVRVATWLVLVMGLWLIRDPIPLLVMFLVMTVVTRLAEGAGGLCFLGAVAKVVPAGRRGAFFRDRQLYGGLLAVGTSAATGWVLSVGAGWQFPHQFALLFTLYAAMVGLAIVLFAQVREEAEVVAFYPHGVVHQLRRARGLLGADGNYRRFLLARILMVLADMALPFYVVYAREQLGAPPAWLAST